MITQLLAKSEEFWEGAQKQQSLTEGFQYGFERGIQGEVPWYINLFWLALVGLFTFACWKEAKKRNRNPWIWGGLTIATILLPLLCWVPYVALRILGTSTKQRENGQ